MRRPTRRAKCEISQRTAQQASEAANEESEPSDQTVALRGAGAHGAAGAAGMQEGQADRAARREVCIRPRRPKLPPPKQTKRPFLAALPLFAIGVFARGT